MLLFIVEKRGDNMSELLLIIGEWFGIAGTIAIFMAFAGKLINMLINAFVRGEIVV